MNIWPPELILAGQWELIFLALLIGSGLASWIGNKLKEQQQRPETEERVASRSSGVGEPPTRQTRLDELGARRSGLASWIDNKLKELQQRREAEERVASRSSGAGEPPTRQTRLDELGARRRQTSEKPSRTRSPAAEPTSEQPSNLTIAQRRERLKAQAGYKRRASQLTVQREAKRERGPIAKTPQQPLGAHDLGQGIIRRVALSTSKHSGEVVHRHVPDVPSPIKRSRKRFATLLGGKSLRDAIVLKEILDQPVGLRGGQNSSYI